MFIGIALVVAGVLLVLSKMGIIYGDFWDYFWPIVLIALGAKMVFDHKNPKNS